MLRIQRAGAMCSNFVVRQQAADGVIGQRHDFINFVRGAETIKEVNKRHAAFERGDMRNERKVLRFLHACGAQHSAAGLAYGHDVRVIAKDRQRVGRHGSRGDVQNKRR